MDAQPRSIGPRPHSKNRAFQWRDITGPYRRLREEQARQWNEEGWFVLEDAFDPATVSRAIGEIDPWEEKAEAALRERGGRRFIARADERAGSIVVFSSLTPHATGPNRSRDVRRAYIVQLALDGTELVREDPESGGLVRIPQNDPERQCLVCG